MTIAINNDVIANINVDHYKESNFYMYDDCLTYRKDILIPCDFYHQQKDTPCYVIDVYDVIYKCYYCEDDNDMLNEVT